jgi:hypothetical protein
VVVAGAGRGVDAADLTPAALGFAATWIQEFRRRCSATLLRACCSNAV